MYLVVHLRRMWHCGVCMVYGMDDWVVKSTLEYGADNKASKDKTWVKCWVPARPRVCRLLPASQTLSERAASVGDGLAELVD